MKRKNEVLGVKDVLDIVDVAKYLDCSTKSIRRWCEQKKIPFFKIGQMYRFRMTEIDQWIQKGGSKQ